MLDLSRRQCLGEVLRDAVVAFKSNLALIEANRDRESARRTYRELAQEAELVAAWLQSQGFKPGDCCAIVMSNQSRWIIGALGVLWSGGVLVPLDYKLTSEEQLVLLRHARPSALLTEYPVLRALGSRHEGLTLVSEAPEGPGLGNSRRWESLEPGSWEQRDRTRCDVACIVYSSGTGGRPKGCQLTHGNYLTQTEALGNLFPLEETDSSFSILPTNHAIDFMCGFVLPLCFGASVIHQRTLRPEFIASTMRRYGVTHMALVPRVLDLLASRIRGQVAARSEVEQLAVRGLASLNALLTWKKPRPALSRRLLAPIHDQLGGRLKLLVCGGAFVPRETVEFFRELGIPVAVGYGLTEACTVVTVNDLAPPRADTVGRPVKGVEVELRDPNGSDTRLPLGAVGEVWIRGPTVMTGYLDEAEATQETLIDGWLRTGDLGRFDASGHLTLVGRLKNMIVTAGGKNVSAEEVEAAFDGLGGVEEHAVFSSNYLWPGESLGDEVLVLVLRLKSGVERSVILSAVRQRNQRLVDYKRLGGVVIWSEDFPRTASLKLQRHRLAAALREAAPREQACEPLAVVEHLRRAS